MAAPLSHEETQQFQRTVEMFEAITDSQPDDPQSLEILKEAYNKLGRSADGLRVSKRLAKAYLKSGQISQAILEYEGIAREFPADADAKAALAELEARAAQSSQAGQISASPLVEDSKPHTPTASGSAGTLSSSTRDAGADEGDRNLANALVAEKVISAQAVESFLAQLKKLRAAPLDRKQALSLLPLLVSEQIARMDDVLLAILKRSRLPYIPLANYDIERDTALMLPEDVCWRNCLVPFDLVSRSVLIATANPFDHAARKLVESLLHYHVFWYVANPADIVQSLRYALGLETRNPQAVAS